jgi:hypothetical protein
MVDGGGNICLTGTLSLLVDTISIPPISISVAVEGAGHSLPIVALNVVYSHYN